MSRYFLPTDFDVAASLGPGLELVIGPQKSLTTTYLDTFDWRLWRAGVVLVEESGHGRRLVLLESDREPYSHAIEARPGLAADLPKGHLADRIGPLMGIRALIPIGAAHVDRRDGRVENADGDIVALLRFDRVAALDRQGNSTTDPIATLQLRGDPGAAGFESLDDLTALVDHGLEMVTAVRGRRPGDYSSKLRVALDPEQTADSAVRRILLDLAATIEANVEGTMTDLDSEFLHDLRVACRRTRSALSQLKGVLAAETAAPYNAEFKWLGNVTGPLRDLDVYLLEMPGYHAVLPAAAAADLEPLEKLIRSTRNRALKSVAQVLRSTRFARLMTSWRQTLEATEPSPTAIAACRAIELADTRISKAYRRILKRGAGFDDDPPAEALHRLRIDAKKLRYLLEFFRSLYPEQVITARINELKQLQDILGGLNDMEVQRKRLTDFAHELHGDPAVPTSCILTVGRLAAILEERQEGFRMAFHDAFMEFSGRRARAAFSRISGGKGSK